MLQGETWIPSGKHAGQLVASALERLSAVSDGASLSIRLLDAVVGHEGLSTNLAARALIDDLKMGRIGAEWTEERHAIAVNDVEEFSGTWPAMRNLLHENWLVAVVSALENFVKSVLVEFPRPSEKADAEPIGLEVEETRAWISADNDYRKLQKAKQSTSAAWIALIGVSSVPDEVKSSVLEWARDGNAQMIDEMVLLRNSIVHRAGRPGDRLARRLRVAAPDRLVLSEDRMKHYPRAYWGFVVSIDPSI